MLVPADAEGGEGIKSIRRNMVAGTAGLEPTGRVQEYCPHLTVATVKDGGDIDGLDFGAFDEVEFVVDR